MFIRVKFLVLVVFSLLFFCDKTSAQNYEIHSDFGNLTECDTLAQGRFLLWWDTDYPLAEASSILDRLNSYADECNTDLNMNFPPNSQAGAYVNVYIHISGPDDYLSQFVGGNGVGTENYNTQFQGPYWSTGRGTAVGDFATAAHEIFHVMQYDSNSPGYEYSGSSQWYTEASASFYAMTRYPESSWDDVYILRNLPQVPIWLSWTNLGESNYPMNWQRETHQYAMNILLYYWVEEKNVPVNILTEGYYSGTDLLPQEYIAEQIGMEPMRSYFVDFAAMLHNDYNFVPESQLGNALDNFNTYSDPTDIHEFVLELNNGGTDGWYSPNVDEVTTGWSFNTYKLLNSRNGSYTFTINGNPTGSYSDASNFRGKILVKKFGQAVNFYDVPMASATQGEITINLTADDYEVDFIVASVPDRLDDDQANFQTYGYQINITDETLSIDENSIYNKASIAIYPNPASEVLNLETKLDSLKTEIFNIRGQSVLKSNHKSIDIHLLSAGIYIVKCEAENSSQTLKLVVE